MSVIQFAKLPHEYVSSKVVAIYVSAIGPYPRMVREWYDVARDARNYLGPLPVVAHPPCGPWGALKGLCTKQDKLAGPRASDVVRTFGGVLEHPAHSSLFAHCKMPRPRDPPDKFGGVTFELDQLWFGHKCRKRTWIYVVHKSATTARYPDPPYASSEDIAATEATIKRIVARIGYARRTNDNRVASHVVASGREGRPSASARMRTLTPVPFAKFLIRIAEESAP